MHYQALATDYDGTLAADGRVDETVLRTLEELRASGRRLILVSGREHHDLVRVFPALHVFDRVVLENGAVLIRPDQGHSQALAEPPPQRLVDRLREHGISPLSVGDVIVSSWTPNETIILETIRELGLEHQIIFNKGAVMVLPPGINKASGLEAALSDLQLSPHNVVGIGDAENDQAFLKVCGCAVAVANALPSVKQTADIVTAGARGAGVQEIAQRLIANDLAEVSATTPRHRIALGTDARGKDVLLPPQRAGVLVAGTSGSGKSTLVHAILERLSEQRYQYVVIDPEGDYQQLPVAVTIGDRDQAPRVAQILDVLEQPDTNAVASLLAIRLDERPAFFKELLSALFLLRHRVGRPHWIVVDEAHHMLPCDSLGEAPEFFRQLAGVVLVTVHPDHICAEALSTVDLVFALGRAPRQVIEGFCRQMGEPVPEMSDDDLASNEALIWMRDSGSSTPVRMQVPRPRGERKRHIRKYAQGELGEDKSFYFRGPDNKFNLRAQNLILFMQLAEGVDDATWLHHLQSGDYSRWFRDAVKDEQLAAEAAEVESALEGDPVASRERIRSAIERRYTGPASLRA